VLLTPVRQRNAFSELLAFCNVIFPASVPVLAGAKLLLAAQFAQRQSSRRSTRQWR